MWHDNENLRNLQNDKGRESPWTTQRKEKPTYGLSLPTIQITAKQDLFQSRSPDGNTRYDGIMSPERTWADC